MSGLGRTFSFNDDDEASLSANRRSYLTQDSNAFRDTQPSSPPAYTDSPTRRYNDSPPPPPAHRSQASFVYQVPQPIDSSDPEYTRPQIQLNTRQAQEGAYGNQGLDHSTSNRTTSTITPGADNMGERAAGGGIAGIAYGVANTNERESGVEAMRGLEDIPEAHRGFPPERGYDTLGTSTPYVPAPPSSHQTRDPFSSPAPSGRSNPFDDGRGSDIHTPGDLTPRGYPSTHSIPLSDYPQHEAYDNAGGLYSDSPYNRFSTAWDPQVGRGDINPDEIEDDGDDGMAPPLRPRRSILGLKNQPNQSGAAAGAAGVGGAAAAGGVLSTLGGLVGRKNAVPTGARDPSGQYGPVPGSSVGPGFEDNGVEKSQWLSKQTSGRKRLRWIVGIIVALVVIGAIVGGVIGALKNRHSSDSSSSDTGSSTPKDSDLDMNSAQIKKLMNNPGLHKVFPGVDYTPFNAQYPACLTNPPSQDNVTMDVAVLSQLTNTIRLYGTDCNQTEMVLHSISKLALPDMKVWLGVWLDNNSTTNNRGLSAMYDILSKNGAGPFAGVIVGNEVLYRKDMTLDQLGTTLSGVRQNLTNQKIDLPVATSDLGDSWTAGLAADSDLIMSNVHPFFAGVGADVAAAWTYNFWTEKDTPLTQGTNKINVISETGWPSAGGKDCGNSSVHTCTPGSVAGVDEMNTFMDTFICQSLTNKTDFFWWVEHSETGYEMVRNSY